MFKPSNESTAKVGQHHVDEYNTHRLAYIHASPDEKLVSLELLRNFVHNAVLENQAGNSHKEFASYYHPVEKQHLLLLGNIKIYSTDKNKRVRVELKCKEDEATKKKSEARAALPSISAKSATKNQP